MSIYTFSAPSPVRRASFRHANDRPPIALLTAADGVTPDQAQTLRAAMKSCGWPCVAVAVDGRAVLQVSGFESDERLLRFMQQYHFVQGQPQFTAEPGDNPACTTAEWFQDNSQKLAGWANAIGDVSLLIGGLVKGDSKEISTGALYTAGAGVLARYGNIKTERHLREVSERTAEFLKKQAVKLPPECGLFHIMQEKREGVLPNIDQFLSRYPTQTMVGVYTLGAFNMLQAGIKNHDPWGMAYGANSTLAGLASILIPEKSKDTAKKQASGPLGQIWDWVQEKPLRMVGYAYILSDIALAMSAYREYKTNPQQKGYIFKFISAASFTLGSVMLAISNKDHANADGKFDADEQRRIEAQVAEALYSQPKEMQAALVSHVAGFLALQAEMKGTAQDIAEGITEQLRHIGRNPWTVRGDAGSGMVLR